MANEEMHDIKHLTKFAGKCKLLSKAQERDLVWIFQTASELMVLYYRLQYAEGLTFAAFCRQKSIDILVSCNLRLIIKYALAFQDRGVPLSDLVNEGTDGFIHACEKFELDRNLKLSTYSTQWIRQRMGRSIENKSRVVKIPPNVLSKATRLKKIYRIWVEKYGEPPGPYEISEQFLKQYNEVVTPEEVEELGRFLYSHESLDKTIGEDENVSMVNYIASNAENQPEAKVERVLDQETVYNWLGQISEEDRKFVMLKYGLIDEKVRNDKEMANIYGIEHKEVKAREKRIMEELRNLASREQINADFLCDVLLSSIVIPDSSKLELADQLSEFQLDSKTWLRIFKDAPCRIFYKIRQDKAHEIRDLMSMYGADVRVVPHG